MKILSVGSAFPEHEYSQQELTETLATFWKQKYFNVERLRDFHEHLLVGSRRFCVTLEELASLGGFQQRNDHYLKNALSLGEVAIRQALDKAGLHPHHIDHLFFTTVTGLAVPSIDARLINRLSCKTSIRRTPLFGLGCLGGAAGIARAADYVKAYPDQIAVLLSVELCSLTMQHADLSIANIVGSGLFGDGAAAVIVAGDQVVVDRADDRFDEDRGLKIPRIVKTHASFYPDTERIMGWDIVDEGFKIVLSPNVPKMVREHAAHDIVDLFEGTGVSLSQIRHYICHPGGPKVLQALQETLDVAPDHFRLSWKTLKDIGNLSSTSVLLVLQETMETCHPHPGDWGLLMAMGPGFCSEWVLLQW